jgi:hypothetical protein
MKRKGNDENKQPASQKTTKLQQQQQQKETHSSSTARLSFTRPTLKTHFIQIITNSVAALICFIKKSFCDI